MRSQGPHTLWCVPDGDFSVGFDLDMTLADTRAGIGAVYDALAAETGVRIDSKLIMARVGPPLEAELANWFPAGEVPRLADRYRELYPRIALDFSVAMPGAAEAIEAVHACGGRVVVVTAKSQRNAELTVGHLGLTVDLIAGDRFAAVKGRVLAEHGAVAYVGDHTADIDAARAAGVCSVAVATGGFDAALLRAHGADVVLSDLLEFPAWIRERRQ